MDQVSRILIIKWGAFGDVLSSAIALKALKAAYPSAKLVLLTNPIGVQLFGNDKNLAEVFDYKQLQHEYGKLGLLRFLRQQKFDIAINLRWYSARCALYARLCAKIAVGYGPKSWRWCYQKKAKLLPANTPILEYNIIAEHVRALGCTVPLEGYIPLSDSDQKFAADFFATNALDPNNTLLLAPSASNTCKCWPLEKFIEACQLFQQQFPTAKILLNWMPGDEELVRECQAKLTNVVLQPATSLTEVCALVELATLVFCNNSGLMNAAYMLKKPIVCLNTAYHWTLEGDNIISINAFAKNKNGDDCAPVNEAQTRELLAQVPVKIVVDALVQLWLREKEIIRK
jgi:ADP-heptose:LPS heptosyltransferase